MAIATRPTKPNNAMLQPGDVLDGQFEIVRPIGAGSFGVVYEAFQRGLKRRVAVKALHSDLLDDREVLARFEREARLASALTSPHAAAVYAFGVRDRRRRADDTDNGQPGIPYLVMEFLDGPTVAELALTRPEPLPVGVSLQIVIEALEALGEAHDRGFIHRDLKPENLVLVRTQRGDSIVKLLDFGIAKAVNPVLDRDLRRRLTADGMVCGTPLYMAPEQAMAQEEQSPALDVYSAGCLLFELLTGLPPYTGKNAQEIAARHVDEPVPHLDGALADTPVELVVQRALAKNPDERYADATDLRTALVAAAGQTGIQLSLAPLQQLADVQRNQAHTVAEPRFARTAPHAPPVFGVARDSTPELPADQTPAATSETSATEPRISGVLVAMIAVATVVAIALTAAAIGLLLSTADTPEETKPRVTITIESLPPNALVTVAGDPLGRTPLAVTRDAEGGNVLVDIELTGHQRRTLRVPLDRDRHVVVELPALDEPEPAPNRTPMEPPPLDKPASEETRPASANEASLTRTTPSPPKPVAVEDKEEVDDREPPREPEPDPAPAPSDQPTDPPANGPASKSDKRYDVPMWR